MSYIRVYFDEYVIYLVSVALPCFHQHVGLSARRLVRSLARFVRPGSPRARYACTSVRMQTMVSGVVSLEVDHKKGLVVVRGRPEAVEEGRKEFQNKLASLFPGEFLAVRSCSSFAFLVLLSFFFHLVKLLFSYHYSVWWPAV